VGLPAERRFGLVDATVVEQHLGDLLVSLQRRRVVGSDASDQVLVGHFQGLRGTAHQAQALAQVAGGVDRLPARAQPQRAGQALLQHRQRILQVVEVGLRRAQVVQRVDEQGVFAAAARQRQRLVEQVERTVVVAAHRHHDAQRTGRQVGIHRRPPVRALVQGAQQRLGLVEPFLAPVPQRAGVLQQLGHACVAVGDGEQPLRRLQTPQALLDPPFAELEQGEQGLRERLLDGVGCGQAQHPGGQGRRAGTVGDQGRQRAFVQEVGGLGCGAHGSIGARRRGATPCRLSARRDRDAARGAAGAAPAKASTASMTSAGTPLLGSCR